MLADECLEFNDFEMINVGNVNTIFLVLGYVLGYLEVLLK